MFIFLWGYGGGNCDDSILREKCVVSGAECVVMEGAHKMGKRPNPPFYIKDSISYEANRQAIAY